MRKRCGVCLGLDGSYVDLPIDRANILCGGVPMSPLQTFLNFEMKRVMANAKRAFPDADAKAVKLHIVHLLQKLELAEVQPEDIRERNAG